MRVGPLYGTSGVTQALSACKVYQDPNGDGRVKLEQSLLL